MIPFQVKQRVISNYLKNMFFCLSQFYGDTYLKDSNLFMKHLLADTALNNNLITINN